MATRLTHTLRGFGRFDRRFKSGNIDRASSSFSEGGARPGVPDPQGSARIVARVHAEQQEDAEVRIQRQGYPGPDSAMAAYRVGTGNWVGWDPPNVLHEDAVVEWTTSNDHTIHDVTTLPKSQRPVAVYTDDTNALWKSRTWSYSSQAWGTAVTVDEETADAIGNGYPIAVEAVAEDHLLAFCVVGASSAESAILCRSSDGGDNWSRVAAGLFDVSSITLSTKAVLKYQPASGQLLLLVCYEQSAGVWWVRQYASSDLGTFTFVDDMEIDTDEIFTAEAILGGGFVLVYRDSADSNAVKFRRIGDAFDALERSPAESLSSSLLTDLTSARSVDGKVWLFGQNGSATAEALQWVSIDGARTWTALDYSGHDSSGGGVINNYAATWALNSMWLNYNPNSPVVGGDGSLMTVVLGGWTGYTTGLAVFAGDLQSGRWGSGATAGAGNDSITLLPYETFGYFTGVTATDAGTPTETVADGAHRLVCGASDSRYWTTAPGSGRAIWEGLIYTESTHGLSNWMRVWCRSSNLAIYLRYDRAKFELHDNDTSKIGSTVNIDLTTPLWVRLERTATGGFRMSYRRPWSSTVTTITGSLGNAAGAGTEVGWGNTVTQSVDAYYRAVWVGSVLNGGSTSAADTRFGTRVGTDVHGRALGGVPVPLLDLGTITSAAAPTAARLSLQSGPGGIGDTIDIDAEHDYPVERVFPIEQPGLQRWRSATTTAPSVPAQTIIVELNGTTNTGLGSSTIVWPVIGVNFPTAYLEGYNGSTYDTLATWDGTTGLSGLTCAVDGDVITPAAGTSAAGRYIQQRELVGGYISSGSGSAISKIEACEGGVWAGSGTTTKKASLRAAGVTAGTCSIWHHSGVVVVHNVDLSGYEHFRVRIPSTTTAEGYFTAASLAPAAFKPLGREWDWQFSDDWSQQVRETGGGYREHRREELRPAPRSVTLSQQDGYLLHKLRGSSPDPPYIAADAGDPLALAEEAYFTLPGLLREIGGDPLVLLRKVGNANEVITDPSLWLYGHLVSDVGFENVRGNEGVNEHKRMASITIREITSADEATE